eukprot:414832-Rhodomonas_salina.2
MMFVCLYSVGENPRSNAKNSSEDSTTTKTLSALRLGGGKALVQSSRQEPQGSRVLDPTVPPGAVTLAVLARYNSSQLNMAGT